MTRTPTTTTMQSTSAPSNIDAEHTKSTQEHTSLYENLLFMCYCLIAVDYACLETMPSSLFSDIAHQLGTSEQQTSYIVLGRTFGYIVSTFVAAFVMDKFHASHRYYGTILIMGAIATISIPFSSDYYVQMALWAMTGVANGTIDTALPVYSYRFWSENGASKFMTFLVIKGFTTVIFPLAIQMSVSILGTYRYALFLMALIAIIAGLMAFFLETPQHDALRSLQLAMQRQSSLRDPTQVQRELAVHSTLKNGVVMLWCSFMVLFGLVQSGTLTHATVYCTEYLGVSAGIGRYLIAMYCGGQLFFRVLVTVVPESVETVINSIDGMVNYLRGMVLVMTCLTALWLFMPIQYKLYTLFLVFPALGFVIGGLAPYCIKLVDSVTPISGTISCIFMMLYGAGDFAIVFVNGELIQTFGAMIQPAAICAYCLLSIPVLALTVFLYRRYQRIQAEIIGKPISSVSRTSEGNARSPSTTKSPSPTPSSVASSGSPGSQNVATDAFIYGHWNESADTVTDTVTKSVSGTVTAQSLTTSQEGLMIVVDANEQTNTLHISQISDSSIVSGHEHSLTTSSGHSVPRDGDVSVSSRATASGGDLV